MSELKELFLSTRQQTENICRPLKTEDYVVQPIVDVSPPKWHLGHTTWFFEEFVLSKFYKGYKRFHDHYAYVFNSYYESVGKRVVRTDRGNLSRPCVEDIYKYRSYVTTHMNEFLNQTLTKEHTEIIEIGIHHEKQHQELLLTDIKYILGNNPLLPVYDIDATDALVEPQNQEWIEVPEGIYKIGHSNEGFSYDNEKPQHKVYVEPYSISNKLVTNGEWLEFINDNGYNQVLLWHTEGWDWVQKNNICAPQYWFNENNQWKHYTLNGVQNINPKAIVTHISYFEAFAFAQWCKKRVPTEFEWEIAAPNFNFGKRWEWTESAYLPYPNYQKPPGAIGEYNGKFMVNQKVLRGYSIATPDHHARLTYRNFFHAPLRWQFTGLRLAQSI